MVTATNFQVLRSATRTISSAQMAGAYQVCGIATARGIVRMAPTRIRTFAGHDRAATPSSNAALGSVYRQAGCAINKTIVRMA